MFMHKKAAIRSIESYLPPQKLGNDKLSLDFPHIDIDKIYKNTGVSQRSIARENECASDLGIMASRKLFNEGIINPEEIDFLIFCTQTPDYFLPSSSCIIQEQLGIKTSCGALDLNLGCSGFVYGLALAKSLIESGQVENVLLITSDVLSKVINPRDLSARFLFSDGASAALISGISSKEEFIGPFIFGTNGKGGENLIIPAGCMRIRPNAETAVAREDKSGNIRSAEELFMDGAEIFNFSLKTVPKAVNQLLLKCHLSLDDIDFFIFHQANRLMLETLRRKIGIPKNKFSMNVELIGNTISSTIPMALREAVDQGKIYKGSNVLLVGFGVGYSWSSSIIRIL